jgi:16S rRNA processing protein RimM
MENNSNRVEAGIIINIFGVKGEVKVMPLTDSPDKFNGFKRVFLGKPGEEASEYEIRKARPHKKWVILRLCGIDSREQAAKLKDMNVYVERDELGQLAEDTYYEADLHGMEVYNPDNELIGVISDILKTPANDVYQISAEGGREFLVPAIKDVVKQVDVAANRMVIDPIHGLI